jgi:hypothetical protein
VCVGVCVLDGEGAGARGSPCDIGGFLVIFSLQRLCLVFVAGRRSVCV